MTKTIFIDGIEKKTARVLYGKEEFTMPAALLPKGIKEGDRLAVSFKIDKAAAEKSKKECEELLSEIIASDKKK